MKMLKKAAEKVKDGLVFLVSIPFVLFSSVVIHLSGADHDTWPSEEEMKAGGRTGTKGCDTGR